MDGASRSQSKKANEFAAIIRYLNDAALGKLENSENIKLDVKECGVLAEKVEEINVHVLRGC
jgi:hypothetical protein